MGLVNINAVLAVLLLLLCLVQPNKASRILYDEERFIIKQELSLQSLRGELPPSEPSKCTYIPGTGGSGCPLNVKNYAGHRLPYASAYPRLMVPFGVATNHK